MDKNYGYHYLPNDCLQKYGSWLREKVNSVYFENYMAHSEPLLDSPRLLFLTERTIMTFWYEKYFTGVFQLSEHNLSLGKKMSLTVSCRSKSNACASCTKGVVGLRDASSPCLTETCRKEWTRCNYGDELREQDNRKTGKWLGPIKREVSLFIDVRIRLSKFLQLGQ